jgi:putative peptide zinc metalloprotease protein
LIICQEPALSMHVQVLESRLQEMQIRYTMEWVKDQAQADLLKEEMALVQESLAQARERVAELTIRSGADGTFVVPQAQDLPGQFVQRGTQLAYVLDLTTVIARVILTQTQIDLVRYRTREVEVRFAEHLDEPVYAVIKREIPGATEELPSLVFSSQGGGTIAIDPTNTQSMKALSKLFQLDLEIPSRTGIVNIGGRVYVRFDHGREPLVHRWYRQIRRLFLSKFHV